MNSVNKVGPSFNARLDGTLHVIENGKNVRKKIFLRIPRSENTVMKYMAKNVAPDSERVNGQILTDAMKNFVGYIEKIIGREIPNKDKVFMAFWQDPKKGFYLSNLSSGNEWLELSGSYGKEALDVEMVGINSSARP